MQINLVWFLLSPLFIEVESPEYRGCAEFQNEFEYCEKKRDQCLSETIETVDCDEKREKCFKENVGDSNCTIEYESNRRKRKQENMENTQIPPMKTLNLLLKNLRNPINDVVKNCSNEDDFENQKQLLQKEMDLVNSVDFSEFSRLKMPTAIIFNALIRNQSISETCKQSLKEFEKKLAILDSAAFSIIPIPFAHWHCGWAYGDVGRVNLRLYASIATRNFAMNFNHVCAIQRDCYMNRKKRKTCDQMFKNSIHGIVNSLKRNKKGAEEFKEILMELSDWKSEYAYSIANLTESSYSTYSENSEGAFTNFNYYYPMNKTAVVFLELKEQPKIKTNLDNLYPCCKFHRNALNPNEYEVPIPVLTDCPFASSMVDFCVSDLNFCINNKSGFPICSSQFCACIKKELPQNEQQCRANITDTCRLLKSRKSSHKEEYAPFKWPEEMEPVVTKIQGSCGSNELDSLKLVRAACDDISISELQSIQSLVQLIFDNQCVKNYKTMIDTSSMIVDKNTDIGVPFDRFRCGWQYGDIGKVLARYWIGNACGPYSVNFNHCCAKHLNCYINKVVKELCDEEYYRCRTVCKCFQTKENEQYIFQSLVSRMVSHKESCRALNAVNNHELFNVKLSVYESFGNTKIPTEITLFDGNLKKSFSGPSNLNFSLIKVFKLSSDERLDIEIGDSFYQEIYKNGWSNRGSTMFFLTPHQYDFAVIIDSSALIFEDCRKHNSILLCLKQLVFSISEIDGKTEEFDVAIRKFNETIASRCVAPLNKSEVVEMISKLENGRLPEYIVLFIVEIVIVLIFNQKCWETIKRIYYYFFSNKTPTQNVQDPAAIPLSQLGPVSELNGSTTFSEDSNTEIVNHPVHE
ncbi:Protein CBG09474 [Caenorhabditis briggsae]|uniref:Protein CBG09474 n=1 Tax=Caenorhabditis briggsae TaxID=6238 RepID=A8X911_CAEBR|nr:Protein CBG09474 [Caenorhabditis briggsae]CAP29123.2 Protein CBG09474 [Caenorhabditis briggsae]